MGKKKIPITFVEDPVKRKIHFHKRVHGLFKKLHELSVLCGAPMCLIVEDENKNSYCYKTDSGGHAKLIAAEYDKLNVSDKVKVYNPSTRTFHNKLKVVRELEDHDQGMIALQNATAEVATVVHGAEEVQLHGDGNLHSAHPGNEDEFTIEWLEKILLSEDDDKDGHNPSLPRHNKLEDQGIIEESFCAAALQNTTVAAATVVHGTKEVQLLDDSDIHSAHPGNEDQLTMEWLENFLFVGS